MNLRSSLAVILLFHGLVNVAVAQLTGSFPEGGGPIVIQTTNGPVKARGLDFHAAVGTIWQGESPAPFEFFVAGQEDSVSQPRKHITLGTLGSEVELDGSVALDMLASADAEIDAYWGDQLLPRPFPVNGNLASEFALPLSMTARVPYVGGFLKLDSGVTPDALLSLDVHGAGLISSGGATPFSLVVTNSVSRWQAKSDVPVTIDGEVSLDLYVPAGVPLEITATNEHSTNSIKTSRERPNLPAVLRSTIPHQGGMLTIEPIEGPTSVRGIDIGGALGLLDGTDVVEPFDEIVHNTPHAWSARSSSDVVLEGPITLPVNLPANTLFVGASVHEDGLAPMVISRAPNPGRGLRGNYPITGGAVSIEPKSDAVSLRGLTIIANDGRIVGGSAAPFESVVENTETTWSVSSSSDVAIDGRVMLDVIASPFALLDGVVETESDSGQFDLEFSIPPLTTKLAGSFPVLGGPISIWNTGDPVEVDWLTMSASGGILIDSGNASPFDRVTQENSTQHWGVLAQSPVVIDGLVTLDVSVTGAASVEASLGLEGRRLSL